MKKADSKFYLVGGGIASLSAAFFLIKDGKIKGQNITIFENENKLGGSLDGNKNPNKKAYVMRGHRILADKTFECTFNLLDQLPSFGNPQKSIKEEIIEFNQKVKTHAKARIIEKGKIIDAHSLGLSQKNRYRLLKILFKTEKSIETLRINDYFSDDFFETNFWLEFCTVFAFQPWHSLIEFRRYILRSFQALSLYDTMDCIISTPYSQHDSIIVPLINYLKRHKVNLKNNCLVKDLFLKKNKKPSQVKKIIYIKNKIKREIILKKNDSMIVTLGSMTANSSFGDNNQAPELRNNQISPSWNFWEKISKKQSDFGNPETFNNHISRSKWESFTITFQDSFFFDLMEKLTSNKEGTGGGTTFKNSNWLLSITLPHQPHFINQPKSVHVCWGYGLSPNKKGNFVKKKMSECNGKEIITELCGHLGFEQYQDHIQKSASCIPCVMPYITSQFSLRKKEDRPRIRPKSTNNLAFIGQYCEIPHDVSFTVEYSVRSAQIAVYSLLNIKKQIPPIYKGYYNLKNLYKAAKTIMR